MTRFRAALFTLILSLFTATTVGAQAALPEFRYVATPDMDFYGADLDAQFETTLDACERACSASSQCAAFTFNTRSRACFPKRAVTDRKAYVGAVSAEKIVTPRAALAPAQERAAQLSFLGESDLNAARDLARTLGLRHQAGGTPFETMMATARARESSGNIAQALAWTGAAVAASDRSDLWADYARLSLAIKTNKGSERRDTLRRAVSASTNAFLRGQTPPERATALMYLAQALEPLERGRDTIPVLRLAADEQPREDINTALEKAIGKYGFRITENTVESDSAAPRICAQFSEPLAKIGVDYEPFVRADNPGLAVTVDGSQLCVEGVEHGERYRLTFRRGLPAASGETLWKDVEITQYVRDRSPAVRFPGRAYVLPKAADAALPVETVNLTKLDLLLRRVSDRNLLRAIQDGYFGRPLSEWQESDFANNVAQDVWTGTAEVATDLNRDMTTRLPMGEAIADQPSGIYALTARIPGADPYDEPGATQWFVLSDLGISTLSGSDGLEVSVRALSDAKALEGVEVTLISRANAVLGTATTDAEGLARFAPGLTRGLGAAAPALVLAALGDSDAGFLSLTDPAFDLSDRGVEGRPPAGPVDVFLTTDRGAYRAGETIHATVLARDATVKAIEGLPLIAILSRPDGVEYRRLISDGGTLGGHVFDIPVGSTVPRGSWRLDIKSDPDAPALASQTVLVEDFLPERIDFTLTLPQEPLMAGDSVALSVAAKYLFGAPGADLSVEGNVILSAARTVAEWPGYRFGRYDADTSPRSDYFGGERTDSEGNAIAFVDLPELDAVGFPMEARFITRVADGSARPVERRLTAPVRPATAVIGIKPLFEDVVAEGNEAAFEVIGLGPDLQPAPMQVKWTLNRVVTRYQWYQLYGDWNWEPTTRRTRIATGEGTLGAAPLTVTSPVDWGRYELVVEQVGGDEIAAAFAFYAGWYTSGDSAATPDRLEMSLDKPQYSIGDTAQLRIVPREAGTALVTVLSNRVIARQVVEVPAGASMIPVPVTEDWGTGAYVTATVIRPMNVAAGQNPARALGLAHAKIDPGQKALTVTIDTPEVAEPRQTQAVKVKVAGGVPGEQAYLTLAAVDVGILNLTGFKSPDPQAHYFGQRRLGVEMRDVYGRLIDGMNGAMGTVRSGGDGDMGARLQSPPPTQDLMAVFSGPVATDANGEAVIDVPLPAFNGTVRLMAVAWTQSAVGQAEHDMLVRDPVVVTATLPRFLAPGDTSRMLLEVVHADGPAGEMTLALAGGAGISLGAGPGRFTLAPGGKATFQVPVTAGEVSDPVIEVLLTTPDGEVLRQALRMPVRSNDPVIALTRRFALGAGQSFAFTNDVFSGMRPGTGKAILSAGPLAKFDAPGLLTMLDQYPYGCTEQVTSKAMPLLYLSSVARAAGMGEVARVQERVDTAIARVISRQSSNGAFGLWYPDSGDFWLDAYVSDFLSRARAEGYTVPDLAFRLAMDNLRNHINYAADFDSGGEEIAYALMVLAREGAAAMGDLRYYADIKGDAFTTPMAAAQVGAALAAYGDQTRADAMFARAARLIERRQAERPVWRADYGTYLRDNAAVLALATEAGSRAINVSALTERVAVRPDLLSTQEATWSLMAAQALVRSPSQSNLRLNGAPVDGPFVMVREEATPAQGASITTADGSATDITLTTFGVPEVPPAAGGNGYAIARSYYSMDGEAIDASTLRVGERFVAVLEVTPFAKAEARLMVDDPLPAGVEIDNPNLLRSGDVGALDWLDPTEAKHAEFRADRFLAQVDLRNGKRVRLAYIARAVSPGVFHRPAASVEDMYRPTYRARSDAGRVTVTE
ncbi:MAG: alpha-2-macroglobulin family protein [Pseudooceanicola sp.]|nr:alpha-2-macroglobulin family protein [Pseudooceanicola sp.]